MLLFWSGWVWITCEGQLRLTTETTMSDARHESHTQLVGEEGKKKQDNLRCKCMSDQSLFQSSGR